ncbi:MAG: TonB-dependent receptor [Acidobacteria bacterium]|nr:TonB-dependent receptor [Acidobacteriota bacterium]
MRRVPSTWLRPVLLVAALALVPSPSRAQVDRATLVGTVRDVSTAVVPGATVTARSVTTNVSQTTITDAQGSYVIASLLPGLYSVDVELSGFKKATREVELQTGQRARVDFALAVGAVEQSVTVAADSPLLNTEQALLGTVVDRRSVQKLPLSLRTWDDLIGGAAGVQGDRYTEQGGSTASGRTGGVNVHGARSLQNNFLLDGLDNNSISTNVQELTTQVARPSVDSIGEFKVVTSPYSAEYGRAPGASISVTTKSGSNALHGTAYEYLRNKRFDATDFFTARQGAAKPDHQQNQFGGNLGGPIVRDRAFFFGDLEGTRLEKGIIRQTVVPTALERQGIFSTAIRDPRTGQPFASNTIPSFRIDPVSAKIMALFPDPNASGASNYFRTANASDYSERYLGRTDMQIDSRNSVFVRYVYSNRDRFIPGNFGGKADGTSTSAWGRQHMIAHGFAGGWNRTVGSSLLNELRVGYNKADSRAVQDPFGLNGPGEFGITGVPDDPRINGGLPGVNFSAGGYRLGSPDFLPKYQLTDQVQVIDTMSWHRGGHQVKVGADLMMPLRNDFLDVPATRGSVTFRTNFTGNVLADFLLGYVSDAQLSNVAEVHQRMWATSFFVQDDWKPGRDLTINAGVRYDFISPALEADNRLSNFDPVTRSIVQASSGSLRERGLVDPDRNNVAPRIGVAYSASSTIVLRGGYGIFYNIFDRIGSEDQLGLNPPFLINNNIQATGAQPLFFLRDGFPATFLDPARLDLSRLRLRAVNPAGRKEYMQQWSGGLQKLLTSTLVVSADYVGTNGLNIATLRDLNQPLTGPDGRTLLSPRVVPFPGFGPIEYRDQDGRSIYHGLELSIDRRYADGVTFHGAYTLSVAKDNAGEHLFSGGSPSFLQDSRNRESWYGYADQDTRHRFAGSWIVDLPLGTGRRWLNEGAAAQIFGGFTFSGVITARSGRPFTVRQSGNNVGNLNSGLPDRVGDGMGPRTVDAWYDVTAFRAVPSGTLGNSGRNILRGPRLTNVDTALHRRFGLTGESALEFRWEIFNLLNSVQLGLPDTNISNRTAGTITNLAGDPRVMQFAVRVIF